MMPKAITFLSFFSLLLHFPLNAQRGIQLNSSEAFNGYTVLQFFGETYLIDNCGDIVEGWDFTTGYHIKIQPEGKLLLFDEKNILEASWNGSPRSVATSAGTNLEFKYEVIALPNGNYLSIGRRIYDAQFFSDRGYNLALGSPTLDDVVVEIDPISNQIVWEWNISDHVIQERDPNISNYGSVIDNPQLLNLDAISTFDWKANESFMINGMDYNEELDQIALSVRKLSEVIIIDHSTTTEEAAGHTQGRSGKGGDILFRWGNPQNYNRGTFEDRVFYFQHNPNWIKYGEHKDKLIVFNNGLNRPNVTFEEQYSSIDIISPNVQSNGNYTMNTNGSFEPFEVDLSVIPELPDDIFYSGYMSGATVLPNGNIFSSIAAGARSLEINPAGELVWYYKGVFPAFRVEKYDVNYAAFEGRNLQPSIPIEGTENNYDCELFTTSLQNNASIETPIKFSNGPTHLFLEADFNFRFSVLNIDGRILYQNPNFDLSHNFDKSNVNTGLYFIRIEDRNNNFNTKKMFIE